MLTVCRRIFTHVDDMLTYIETYWLCFYAFLYLLEPNHPMSFRSMSSRSYEH